MSSMRTQSTGGGVLGLSSIGSDRTGAASTGAGSHSHSHSHRRHHHQHHRSRSAPRAEKPPRKRHLNPGRSLASIPCQIKLSMLNSGLISFMPPELPQAIASCRAREPFAVRLEVPDPTEERTTTSRKTLTPPPPPPPSASPIT